MNTPTPDRQDLDNLKARIDLVDLMTRSGLELKKVGKNYRALCPFHEERTPSFTVNPEARLWQCLGCQKGGDALSFLQLKENLAFTQAVQRLHDLAGKGPNGHSAPSRPGPDDPLPGGLLRADVLRRVVEHYHRRFRESTVAQQYLASRGLGSRELWETFQVGFADGSLLQVTPREGAGREALTQLGVITPKGREHLQGCVVVPLEHPDEGVVGLYGRALDPQAVCPHLYLPGPKRGVLNWQAVKGARRVWLTESVLDAFSLWQAGHHDVTCLYGSGRLPADLEAALRRWGTPEVVLCLDGDRAGQEATARLAGELAGLRIRCFTVRLPGAKDPNQILTESGPAGLSEAASTFQALPAAELPPEPEPLAQATEEGFRLEFGEVVYQATMVAPFVGSLRVALTATRGFSVHSDKLDLFSHRARAALVLQLVKRLELSRGEAERHLLAVLRSAQGWVQERKAQESESDLPQRRKPPELTEPERQEALELLQASDLVERILADAEALGYVGEENAKLLVYLIATSRKLDRPLSAIVRSQSAAGKSSLTELVEAMMPEEDVIFYSRLSQNALYNMPRDYVVHAILMLEERAGAEAADYSIRTLQSRKKLTQAVTIKDPLTGKLVARENEVLGPIAYLETTTNAEINPENASRCFELYLDESEEQTRRIVAAQQRARLPQEHDDQLTAAAIRQRHRNAQRLLVSLPVKIPYADKIQFPTRWLRIRRDHERFLCLIEAITFLHQHQRERGQTLEGTTYLLATLEDYRLAYRLAKDMLAVTLHELSREGQALWGFLREWTRQQSPRAPEEVEFTRRELRQASGYPDHRLRSVLAELVQMEYVAKLEGQNGVTFRYRLLICDAQHEAPLGLTTPEELEALWKGGS